MHHFDGVPRHGGHSGGRGWRGEDHSSHGRSDLIRFSHPELGAGQPKTTKEAHVSSGDVDGDGVGEGNGGDDFTFSFPHSERDIYGV